MFDKLYTVKLKDHSPQFISEIIIGEVDIKTFEKRGIVEIKNGVRFFEHAIHSEQEITDPKTKKKQKVPTAQFQIQAISDSATSSEDLRIPQSQVKLLSKLDVKENAELINSYSDILDKIKMARSGLYNAQGERPNPTQ